MKFSVDRLRWGLAAGVVVLLVGLAGLVTYGRYAAARKWKEILAKNGIHISQESDNVTYSQTVQGRTVFTLRAKKAIPISDGKYKLRGVTLLLYGKTADSVDRIEGDEFEYDEKAGVAKAIGEVHMDIQAPGALTHAKPGQVASGAGALGSGAGPEHGMKLEGEPKVIHVLTSGLVYLRKLGVAATDQRVEFRYEGLTCVSQGAEFDTSGSALHLLAGVEMTGMMHEEPFTVHAQRADLDRQKNTIAVLGPVANSRGESAKAANALLLLRTDGANGLLQHASAWGGVLLEAPARRVAAARMEASFAAQNVPENAVLSGGVVLDGSAAKPMHGTAAEADLAFTPLGAVRSVLGKGAVRLVSSLLRPGAPALVREMRGEQVLATFRPVGNGKKSSLQEVHAVGGALARGESFVAAKPGAKAVAGVAMSGIVTTQVAADDLLAAFAAPSGKEKNASLQHLAGQGHTRLQQDGLNGAQEVSTGDALEASFAAGAAGLGGSGLGGAGESMRLQNAVQTGHVQIRDQAATRAGKRGALSLAHGDRATFDGATDRLTLTGSAAYEQEGTSLRADSVGVEQGSGDAEAQGHVEVSLASVNQSVNPSATPSGDREATHVFADRARLERTAETAEFFGTDAHPARMWQAGSQVMAANLYLDDARQSLTARPGAAGGMVEAIFAAQRGGAGAGGAVGTRVSAMETRSRDANGGGGQNGEAVHVSSPALTYSGLRHEAVCTGGVRLRQGEMQVHAQQVVMFLASTPAVATGKPGTAAAAPHSASGASPGVIGGVGGFGGAGGALERMVFSGNVRLDEPGRAGDGEQLVYTARDATYVLTGTAARPPRVADAGQGMVTGPALVFRTGEKSVIVNGTAASNGPSGHDGHDTPPAQAGGRVHTDVNVRPQQR